MMKLVDIDSQIRKEGRNEDKKMEMSSKAIGIQAA
jgi:hypothetical protein